MAERGFLGDLLPFSQEVDGPAPIVVCQEAETEQLLILRNFVGGGELRRIKMKLLIGLTQVVALRWMSFPVSCGTTQELGSSGLESGLDFSGLSVDFRRFSRLL